ncbi:MAG: hypothetical protein ACYS1A_02305 [Planctomycetota bacterium]|jgi:hypothetical protein
MFFKSRKFLLWFGSLAAVLAICLIVTSLSDRPEIEFGGPEEFTDSIDEFEGKIGKIDGVGVVSMRKSRFEHRNKDGEVDRVLGFEELLHEEGDLWEIKKPYMNVFRHNFKCYLTADIGNVLLEQGVPSLKDATFAGNVVIHILPEAGSSVQESRVYLDDIAFISERSHFSTAGPVKVVAENAEMLGRGVELIYNAEIDRLELLKIVHLENLHLRQSSKAGLFATKASGEKELSSEKEGQSVEPAASQQAESYKCIFHKNVVIDTAEQLVFADEVSINDILFTKAQEDKSSETDDSDANSTETVNASMSESKEMSESPEDFNDVIVTCDGGIIAFGMDDLRKYENLIELELETIANDSRSAKKLKDDRERTTLVARRIDYSALSGHSIADGPVEITFYTEDVMGDQTSEAAVPVKITAQRKAKFLPVLNQVIFEGDCLCVMVREDVNNQQRYTLSAPKLTVDLSKADASAADIEHLTADGGTVRLATIKTAGEKLLGGVELKCSRFDYDAGEQMFSAFGPGVIKVDNSNISDVDSKAGRFSLKKRCWAKVEDFDTLKFYSQSNRIVANAERGKVFAGYVPIIDGQYGQAVKVTASSIEAVLRKVADGQTELSTLKASGGVVYEDEDKVFTGSEFFYDAEKSMITVIGGEGKACYFNGNAVKRIEYDLKKDKVNAEIIGPGVLQINPVRNPTK